VETQLVRELRAERAYTSTRARVISLLGPITVVAGIVWAIIQPYRLTLLHPSGQGFWWLAIEPPALVVIAGVVFAVFVARPLVADLEGDDGAA
jgi:formate hydrogenlyase subunit 3/multisubunit Na+/H+ antiporter MnhD subunit